MHTTTSPSDLALKRIREAEDEVSRTEIALNVCKERTKTARSVHEAAIKHLRDTIADCTLGPGPLFDQTHSEPQAAPDPITVQDYDIESDVTPIESGLPDLDEKTLGLLKTAPVNTICQLHDRIEKGTLTAIKGIGQATANAVEMLYDEYVTSKMGL